MTSRHRSEVQEATKSKERRVILGSDLGRQARPVVYTQVGQEHASGGDEDRSLQLHAGYLSSQSSSLELVLSESPGAQLQAPRDSGSRLIQEGDDMWRGGRGRGEIPFSRAVCQLCQVYS